jgi:hypothetical protein
VKADRPQKHKACGISPGIYRRTRYLYSSRPSPRSEESMRTRFRRALSMVAIAAIAMHAALWGGLATHTATAVLDPFSVICHSGGNADTVPEQAPARSAPSHACDHCNLCGATPPPAASPTAVVVQFLSNQPSHVLKPAPTVPHGGFEVALKGARGPPAFA